MEAAPSALRQQERVDSERGPSPRYTRRGGRWATHMGLACFLLWFIASGSDTALRLRWHAGRARDLPRTLVHAPQISSKLNTEAWACSERERALLDIIALDGPLTLVKYCLYRQAPSGSMWRGDWARGAVMAPRKT
eukprot:5746646-Pleurochrysis_carterae.AAC.1